MKSMSVNMVNDHSMIEHVRKLPKIRLYLAAIIGNRRASMNHSISFYQCSLLHRCFCSVIWVTLMARVASRRFLKPPDR